VAEEFRAVTKLDSEKGMMKNHKKQRRNYEKKQKNLASF